MSPSRGLPRLFYVFLLLQTILSSTLALQSNLAGIVDWHTAFIGVPLLEPTPPTIVDSPSGKRWVGITRKNALAVLDVGSGEVGWRQVLEDRDPVVSYHVKDDAVLLLSGPSGATARLFNLTTGHAVWERTLHDASTAQLTTPVHLGTDAAFTTEPEGSVVILSDGRRISKLSLRDGLILWSLDAPGAGSTILFKQLLVSDNVVHILAITSSFASQTLTTVTLNLSTSAPVAEFTQIPSIVEFPSDAHLAASDTGGSARVVWFEHGRIRTVYLGRSGQLGGVKDLLPGKGRTYRGILNAQARREGWVLGQMGNGEVDVIDVRSGGRIVTTMEGSGDSEDKSPSVYSVSNTKNGVVFHRVYWSFVHNWAVFESSSISPANELLSSGYSFAFDTAAHGIVLAAAGSSNIIPTQLSSASQLPSVILTTSSGAIQLITPDTIAWTREESLSDIAAVRFVDLGEPEVEEARHLMTDETFVSRVTRHVAELKNLPGYLIRFFKRFTTASYTSAVATTPLSSMYLHRDQFGFQKLVVVATKGGKVVAMDSANGGVVWARNLGVTNENGTELVVEGMWNVRDHGEVGEPMLAVLATRTRGETVSTVGFHVNAYTGEVSGEKDGATGLPIGMLIFGGRHRTAFLVPFENCGTKIRVLVVVDQADTVHIFPSCTKVARELADIAHKVFYTTLTRDLIRTTLNGRVLGPLSSGSNVTLSTSEVWTTTFAPSEIVLSRDAVVYDNIASFGRVLGDKSTLYKYLDPHLEVITAQRASEGAAGVYVVDTTDGRVVYSAEVQSETGLKAKMVENWLVYAWLSDAGWRISSVELYEVGKGRSPGTSTFAEKEVKTVGRTFILPYGVKSIGFTTSKFGITAKELIVINTNNQVASIPRRLLDPRRPTGKPTSSEKEELLIPYEPLLPLDPKRVISHTYPVQVHHLSTSPALVESTSLILGYGMDLFFTRGLNPSGTFDILSDTFNKAQLLLTLLALTGGIAMARPAVRRKMLKMRWYA